jgi:hypothetical protein
VISDEILLAFKNGAKIRMTHWLEGTYIFLDDITNDVLFEDGEGATCSLFYKNDKWELYKEPMKKPEPLDNYAGGGINGKEVTEAINYLLSKVD